MLSTKLTMIRPLLYVPCPFPSLRLVLPLLIISSAPTSRIFFLLNLLRYLFTSFVTYYLVLYQFLVPCTTCVNNLLFPFPVFSFFLVVRGAGFWDDLREERLAYIYVFAFGFLCFGSLFFLSCVFRNEMSDWLAWMFSIDVCLRMA